MTLLKRIWSFLCRRKKWIFLTLLLIAAVIGSWYIGRKLHPEGLIHNPEEKVSAAGTETTEEPEPVVTADPTGEEISEISFHNVSTTKDNPWGFTAGNVLLENEGSRIFLTPETGATVHLKDGDYAFICSLFQEVASGSDGVDISVEWLDKDDHVLYQQEEQITGAEDTVIIRPDRVSQPTCTQVRFTCGNGQNGNSDADWLIIQTEYRVPSTFGKDGYVKSATYFGDAWPMNFWNSEMDHLDEDLKQIRGDGFNSIILVIPWKEFQISTEPIQYSEYAFDQLQRVMKAAENAGLQVYTRISYLWDFINDDQEDVFERVIRVFHNPVIRNAWLDYARELYHQLSQYDCFAGGFLTWEDYMKPVLTLCDKSSLVQRVDDAKLIGFQDWIRNKYTLEEYNSLFGTEYIGIEDIPIPRRNEPAMEAMYAFYDDMLNQLLADGQKVFPNLSNEVRLDADLVYDPTGQAKYYTHETTYNCGQANYTAAMYGIPMGFENVGERVEADKALEHTRAVLSKLAALNGGKPVFLEQFIFYDNTPQFVHNARLEEDQVDDYLLAAPDLLKQYSRGYGIWTYRDYHDNMLYNNGFFLKERGWETEGKVSFDQINGSTACCLAAPAKIRQKIPEVRDHFDAQELIVSFEVPECQEPGVLLVKIGEEQQEIQVGGKGNYELKFERQNLTDLTIELISGRLYVDNLCVYSHIQNGYLYDPENHPLENLDAVRKMNELLNTD